MHFSNKRNNVNTENQVVRDLASSAFDLSHKTKDSGRIGRRELISYEMVMPGDKMRLNSQFNLQFQPTSSNMLPSMDMRIEHVFVPFRVVNRDYEDQSSYVEGEVWLNQEFPSFVLTDLEEILTEYIGTDFLGKSWGALAAMTNPIAAALAATNRLRIKLTPYYLGDYADQLYDHLRRLLSGWSSMSVEAKKAVMARVVYDLFTDFIGLGSYLDKLNAPVIKRSHWERELGAAPNAGEALHRCMQKYDNLPVNEMVVRALYCDWFETTRDSVLEPSKTLPRYNKFGAGNIDKNVLIFCCLVPRYALFDKDIYVTANTDSPYRHVQAPVNGESPSSVFFYDSDLVDADNYPQFLSAPSSAPSSLRLAGMSNSSALGNQSVSSDYSSTFGLDLVALKRAKMARAWLMRGHIFGDEYQDFLLAQYGVKLSDARVNKPWRLGGYSKEVNIDTTTNPTATSEMPAGAKNCSMKTEGGTDNKEFFTEEAGVVFTWAYLVPSVTYNPYDIRHTMKLATDIPQPVMANQSEELSYAVEMSRDVADSGTAIYENVFGRHPYAHPWRGRVDENHGQFLDEYLPMTFLRQFDENNVPVLNSAFIHCHVNLDFMVDTDSWNPIYFGTFSHNVGVVRKLPIVTDEC